jgi:hypothetical protein
VKGGGFEVDRDVQRAATGLDGKVIHRLKLNILFGAHNADEGGKRLEDNEKVSRM